MGAKDAAVLRDGAEVRVPVTQLQIGDVFIPSGEKIAIDGRVVEGSSAIDESMLTGESVPVEATVGTKVTSTTLNTSGRLLVEVTRVGADTTLSQMAKLVTDAQAKKAPVNVVDGSPRSSCPQSSSSRSSHSSCTSCWVMAWPRLSPPPSRC